MSSSLLIALSLPKNYPSLSIRGVGKDCIATDSHFLGKNCLPIREPSTKVSVGLERERIMLKKVFVFLIRSVLKLMFQLRVEGLSLVGSNGPIILTPNHVSWLDAALLGTILDHSWKFVASAEVTQRNWLLKLLIEQKGCILVDPAIPFALREVARHLQSGGKVVIFPEGGLSHTGRLRKFYEGIGFLMMRSNAPVTTCYIRNAHLSLFSRREGKKLLFPHISVHFSRPEYPPSFAAHKLFEQRQRVTGWLRDRMIREQFEIDFKLEDKNILAAIRSEARRNPSKKILQDISGVHLTYRSLVLAARLLSTRIAKRLEPQERRVLLLLPNVNAMPLTLMALWQQGRTPAILNYSSGPSSMVFCCSLAGAQTLITSRAFLDRAKIDIEPFKKAKLKIHFLEDIRSEISLPSKLFELARQIIKPSRTEELGAAEIEGNTEAVILFTSGSEGQPKGVALSHRNIIANIRQLVPCMDFVESDKFFNALPMFHSFGLSLGSILPLAHGMSVFVYPSPLHFRTIPSFVYDAKSTIFLATNTFLQGYARRANPYDFFSVRLVCAGAEKLQKSTSEYYSEIFGTRTMEGYGATECSPIISLNTPFDPNPGTVGKLLPGIEWKLEPVEGVSDGGRLFVKGPNIMMGYLNTQENEKFQKLDGWYDTGDVVSRSDKGVFSILGRMKRFAKISGEMVSLTAVEEILTLDVAQRHPQAEVAVVSIPDKDKGEALVAIATEPSESLENIRRAMSGAGYTALCTPRYLIHLPSIPKLGSGKTDYVSLNSTVRNSLS